MANIRQYIGARYTIKIYENSQDAGSAEWEANTSYEPLVMVTYNNSSYLSKKDVPANIGNPAQNPLYWIITGAYNGQIAALQAQIDAINNNELPAITAQIQTLTNLIGASYGNVIFIGDSYNNPSYSDWGNYTATALGLTSTQYASLYVDGGSISGGQFNTLISDHALTMTQTERDNVTHIICGGGINDTIVSANDLKTAMTSFINLCKSYFTNATIYMAFIGNSIESSNILHGRGYANIAKALGVYRNVNEIGGKYLDGLEYVLHDYSLMASDGIHPTQAGGAQIGKYIKMALENGKAHIMRNFNSTTAGAFLDTSTASAVNPITITDAARADSEYVVNVNQDNGVETFSYFGRIIMTCETFIGCNASTHIQLGTSKLNLVNGKKPLVIDVTIDARDYNDHTVFHNAKGHIVIDGGAVYLYFDSCDNNWSANVAIDQFIINPFSVTADTLLF